MKYYFLIILTIALISCKKKKELPHIKIIFTKNITDSVYIKTYKNEVVKEFLLLNEKSQQNNMYYSYLEHTPASVMRANYDSIFFCTKTDTIKYSKFSNFKGNPFTDEYSWQLINIKEEDICSSRCKKYIFYNYFFNVNFNRKKCETINL